MRVGQTVKCRSYEPEVFSMCKPVLHLEKHLSFDDTGRVLCHRSGMDVFDVWSALDCQNLPLDMRYPPRLASPIPQLLPPFPPYHKPFPSRRYTVKTTPTPAAEVDKQTISGYEPQLKTEPGNQIDEEMQPGNRIDEEMQPGYKPQQISLHIEPIPQEARDALDDMCKLFLSQRKCVDIDECYNLLHENTRTYLRSLK